MDRFLYILPGSCRRDRREGLRRFFHSHRLSVKALKIELKANHFYRGNPYVSVVGTLLGFTEEQLDKFFETNDYTFLINKEVLADA